MRIAEEDLQELRFTVVKGANPGSRISFKPGTRSIRIGRAVDNEIVINDPTVSRSHVQVEIRPDGYFIADAGSASGLEKMGFRVGKSPEPLESGDEFKLGDTILRFEVVAKKGAQKKAAAREAAPKADQAAPGLSPIQKALHRIGLRTPALQIGAAALLVVVLAFLLWPSAPELPPQASDQPVAINYPAIVGYNNVDSSHLDRAIFEVPPDAEGLGIYFDVLRLSGVEIRSEQHPIARLDPSTEWATYELFVIPRAISSARKPLLTFDNLGYSPEQGRVDPSTVKPWALRSMWVARITDTASSPVQLSEEIGALGKLYGRIVDDPGNRYAALKGLRHAILGLMKLAGRPTLLVTLPNPEELQSGDAAAAIENARAEIAADRAQKSLDLLVPAIQRVEGELNREYRRELTAVALARKKGSIPEEITALSHMVKLIPDPTDPRHRQGVSELQRLGVQPEP